MYLYDGLIGIYFYSRGMNKKIDKRRKRMTDNTMLIGGWDYAPSNCKTPFIPFFYFKPDQRFIYYKNINGNFHVPVTIQGTGLYDGFYWIRIDQQPFTSWHVGFLPTHFTGIPPNLGSISLTPPPPPPMNPSMVHSCVLNDCC